MHSCHQLRRHARDSRQKSPHLPGCCAEEEIWRPERHHRRLLHCGRRRRSWLLIRDDALLHQRPLPPDFLCRWHVAISSRERKQILMHERRRNQPLVPKEVTFWWRFRLDVVGCLLLGTTYFCGCEIYWKVYQVAKYLIKIEWSKYRTQGTCLFGKVLFNNQTFCKQKLLVVNWSESMFYHK